MRSLFLFISFCLAIPTIAAASAANICPSIVEGTYRCLNPNSQKTTNITVLKGNIGTSPALKLKFDDMSSSSDGFPCMNGPKSATLCGVEQRLNPVFAIYCNSMGPYAIVINKFGTSNDQSLTFHVSEQHVPINEGATQTVADYSVALQKKSATSFEFQVSAMLRGGQKNGSSLCTKK